MKKRKRKTKKKHLVIIEKPVYYGDRKFYIINKYIDWNNKVQLFFIILYCKMMSYKYEII